METVIVKDLNEMLEHNKKEFKINKFIKKTLLFHYVTLWNRL